MDRSQLADTFGWLAAAWEYLPAVVGVTVGPQHLVVYQNAASRGLFGPCPPGLPILEAFPGTASASLADLDHAFTTGSPVMRDRHRLGVHNGCGDELYMRTVVVPYGPPGDPPTGLVVLGVDLTGEALAELASHRAELLGRVTAEVNAAADAAAAVQALTDTLVPELADVAAVFVLPDVREARALTLTGPPQSISIAASLATLGPFPWSTQPRDRTDELTQSFVAGTPVIFPDNDVELTAMVQDDATRAWLSAARARNTAAIPLTSAGTLIGALLLIACGDRQPYTEKILPLLTDIAARAGVAVGHIRQRHRQAELSHRLQQALLPAAPPPVPGLRIAARYLAGVDDVEVGGDWWDVVRLAGGRLGVGVGDVEGRGIDAAVVMGQIRSAMRTGTLAGLPPGQVLHLLDRQVTDLVAAEAGPQFATALHAVVHVTTGRMVISNAGHLPPLLRRPDGVCLPVPLPAGTPLGVGADEFPERVVELPVGGHLLMFTDGLVEDRARSLDDGLATLAAHLSDHASDDVDASLDKILAAQGAVGPLGLGASDDIAAVLIHRTGEAVPVTATG
ncbi:MAG TPA: GAF domain-containing SpoIIE family protein phosphatase [Kineosporiaceae bacterium]